MQHYQEKSQQRACKNEWGIISEYFLHYSLSVKVIFIITMTNAGFDVSEDKCG